jgi:hypothetical protein
MRQLNTEPLDVRLAEHGLSDTSFAAMASVHRTTLSRARHGRPLTLQSALKISRAFDMLGQLPRAFGRESFDRLTVPARRRNKKNAAAKAPAAFMEVVGDGLKTSDAPDSE